MADNFIQPAEKVNVVERVEHCRYCSAPLSPSFYFCLYCATPYKSPDTVVPIVKMPTPVLEARVAKLAPHVMPLFWTYFSVLMIVAIASAALPDGSELQMYFGSAALVVVTCIFAVRHWPALAVQLARPGFTHWAAWAGLAALPALLGVNYLYHGWLPEWTRVQFEFDFATQVAMICIMPAIVEEIAFRGLVQHWLHVAVNPLMAMVLASALFTILHFSIYSAPYLFAVGLLLGWTRYKTGSLYPAILIHFLHNLGAITVFG